MPTKNFHRHRCLRELYEDGDITARIIEGILNRRQRTAYNYLEGITALAPGQCFEIALRLDRPEIMSSCFQDHGSRILCRHALPMECKTRPEALGKAQADAFKSIADMFTFIDQAAADGTIDSSEQRQIRRRLERAMDLIGQVALPAMNKEVVLI